MSEGFITIFVIYFHYSYLWIEINLVNIEYDLHINGNLLDNDR